MEGVAGEDQLSGARFQAQVSHLVTGESPANHAQVLSFGVRMTLHADNGPFLLRSL